MHSRIGDFELNIRFVPAYLPLRQVNCLIGPICLASKHGRPSKLRHRRAGTDTAEAVPTGLGDRLRAARRANGFKLDEAAR